MKHDRRPRSVSRRRFVGFAVTGSLALAACGSSSGADSDASSSTVLSGIIRDPAPVVDEVSLPSLSDPGTDIDFKAQSGGLEVVYFGFTNCPDVCPTTLSDYRAALNRLERDEAGSTDVIDTVMVTVDPARDLDVLVPYVTSFVPDAVAVGTMDDDLLQSAVAPFGVSYDVRTLDDGTIEVDHSPYLYVVDDQGELVLTWQFGATPTDMASDLGILLDQVTA